jgi:phenylacetate-CoA ligase
MVGADQHQRPYWNMEMETRQNTPEIRDIQWFKVKKKIERLYERTPFWKDWLDAARARPDAIKTWDDYYKRIPIFRKEDYRELAETCEGDLNRILHRLLGDDANRLSLLSATSGTTGDPSPYPFTPEDRAVWAEFEARQLWRANVYPGDKLLHGFGLSMFMGGAAMCMAVSDYGACCVPVGAEAGAEALLNWARILKPKALVGTPSLAEYLIEASPNLTGKSVAALGIKSLLCGGEPGAGIPEVRSKLEGAFGAELFDIAFGGCSCNAAEYQGLHYMNEDLVMYELVDPETHEHIPLEDGARGLLVQTQLDGGIAMAGLRQTPNDLNQVFTSLCPCGKSGFRFKVIGRNDDMLKVKGVMVYPAAIEGVIHSLGSKVTGEFRIVLDEPPPRVNPPLKLKVEHRKGLTPEELEVLKNEIEAAMHARLKIRPAVILVPPNSLDRFIKKKKLFERTYETNH